MTKSNLHLLDLDRELFNPDKTRLDYIKRGYTSSMIEALCKIDKIIYEAPAEEVRAAMRSKRDRV